MGLTREMLQNDTSFDAHRHVFTALRNSLPFVFIHVQGFLPIQILFVKVFIFHFFDSLEGQGPKTSTNWYSHVEILQNEIQQSTPLYTLRPSSENFACYKEI